MHPGWVHQVGISLNIGHQRITSQKLAYSSGRCSSWVTVPPLQAFHAMTCFLNNDDGTTAQPPAAHRDAILKPRHQRANAHDDCRAKDPTAEVGGEIARLVKHSGQIGMENLRGMRSQCRKW